MAGFVTIADEEKKAREAHARHDHRDEQRHYHHAANYHHQSGNHYAEMKRTSPGMKHVEKAVVRLCK